MLQVLKASKNKQQEQPQQNGADPNTNSSKPQENNSTNNSISNNSSNNEETHVNKKQRIQAKITYDDLESTNENQNSSRSQLSLSKAS